MPGRLHGANGHQGDSGMNGQHAASARRPLHQNGMGPVASLNAPSGASVPPRRSWLGRCCACFVVGRKAAFLPEDAAAHTDSVQDTSPKFNGKSAIPAENGDRSQPHQRSPLSPLPSFDSQHSVAPGQPKRSDASAREVLNGEATNANDAIENGDHTPSEHKRITGLQADALHDEASRDDSPKTLPAGAEGVSQPAVRASAEDATVALDEAQHRSSAGVEGGTATLGRGSQDAMMMGGGRASGRWEGRSEDRQREMALGEEVAQAYADFNRRAEEEEEARRKRRREEEEEEEAREQRRREEEEEEAKRASARHKGGKRKHGARQSLLADGTVVITEGDQTIALDATLGFEGVPGGGGRGGEAGRGSGPLFSREGRSGAGRDEIESAEEDEDASRPAVAPFPTDRQMCPFCRSMQDSNATVCGVCGEEMRVDDSTLIALAGPIDPAPTWCLPQTAPVNLHKVLIADAHDLHPWPDPEDRMPGCDRWEDDPTVQLSMDATAQGPRRIGGEGHHVGGSHVGGSHVGVGSGSMAAARPVGLGRGSIRYWHTKVSKEEFLRDVKHKSKITEDDVAISRAKLKAINQASRQGKRAPQENQIDVTAQLGVAWEGLASNINGTLEAPDAIFGKLWGSS